jgi:hypothetical protein
LSAVCTNVDDGVEPQSVDDVVMLRRRENSCAQQGTAIFWDPEDSKDLGDYINDHEDSCVALAVYVAVAGSQGLAL